MAYLRNPNICRNLLFELHISHQQQIICSVCNNASYLRRPFSLNGKSAHSRQRRYRIYVRIRLNLNSNDIIHAFRMKWGTLRDDPPAGSDRVPNLLNTRGQV